MLPTKAELVGVDEKFIEILANPDGIEDYVSLNNKSVEFKYLLLLETGDSEMDLTGFKTKEELEKYIIEFYKEPNDSDWEISDIWNLKTRKIVNFKVNVEVTLTEKE